jgi:two-component system chemotaxis response regulator CheY
MPAAASISTIIVEDQRSVRALIRASLAEIGILNVVEAENGLQALGILSVHAKHLIISDMNMPELDGIGLLRAVRSRPMTAKTAFIMLTSRADGTLVQEAIKLGVNNYIVKPFTIDGLRQKIEAVMGKLT